MLKLTKPSPPRPRPVMQAPFLLNSVVSMYYYLKPVVAMYFRDGAPDPEPRRDFGLYTALGISSALVMLLGLIPDSSLEWALKAILGT